MKTESKEKKSVNSAVAVICFSVGSVLAVVAGVLNLTEGSSVLSVTYWIAYAFGSFVFALKFWFDYSESKNR